MTITIGMLEAHMGCCMGFCMIRKMLGLRQMIMEIIKIKRCLTLSLGSLDGQGIRTSHSKTRCAHGVTPCWRGVRQQHNLGTLASRLSSIQSF